MEREFLVLWRNDEDDCYETDEIILAENEKANRETFAKHINDSLNHYNGYSCLEYQILSWSLIEK